MIKNDKDLIITFLSTWPETPDGIATFCENLVYHLPKKLSSQKIKWNIVRVDRYKQVVNKNPDKIIYKIKYNKETDYIKAARVINSSDTDIVVIQFINSVYGGKLGDYIFKFIDNLRKPLLVILHSVAMLKSQSDLKEKQKILKGFAKRKVKVVAMSKKSQNFLINNLRFNKNDVYQIYHGAPEFREINNKQKQELINKLGFNKKNIIIFSYGILREDKGLKYIINSIKILSKNNNNIRLLLVGSDQENNKYISKIKDRISILNLSKYIKFIPKFITDKQIGEFLQISDIFISAQTNLGLHSSGSLSYALSAGNVIISTPIIHAQELLPFKNYSIVPIKDSNLIANNISKIISNKKIFNKMKEASKKIGQKILWKYISRKYLDIIKEIYNENSNSR